jgi:class 3 adenylate cyclase/tetratricopeptide (TPR) repeat protein
VGSTAIAARLDPEEWRETLAGFHRVATAAITRFDGHVAKYLGDGVMAYFGWPAAHDNDAERAARAGLAILDAIANLNEQPGPVKLATRVGIDSGTVVIGKGAGNEAEVFGDTPNIAARVEAAAEPGTVAISDAAHRLVSGLFVVEDLGAQQLKGIEQPLQLYRVVRPSGVRGRFQAATAAGGLTPFVGREDELRSLISRWQRALDSDGQVALIIGEAGIGKSRLVQRFHQQIAGSAHLWIEAGAGALYQSTPFYPITEMLRHALFAGGNGSSDAIAQLAGALSHAGLDATAAVPLLAPMLNLELPAEYPPSPLPPEQQRRRLLATLVEWVLGTARTQPLVIVIEDLHWADPSTLELIQLLGEQGANAELLLLYTARPEFHGAGTMRAHHTQLTLNRLGARDIRTMVAQVAASKALTDDTVTAVVERTGGVPLFVEELTRAVLESGDTNLTGREIPATLHDSLMARLDRLGPAKEVIQVAAVIGSEFSYELLHAVHPIGDRNLQEALTRLSEAELLYVRGIAPDATYQFKHALIRDAAYEALLKSRRKELHLIVARTIDEKSPTIKETRPEVLARHWTEAGETESAITEWSRAGERAVAQCAFREAEQHYRHALAAVLRLPESLERDRRELTIQLALGRVVEATHGWSAVDTASVYARARHLAERSGGTDLVQVFTALNGLQANSLLRNELREALTLADQMLDIARGLGKWRFLVAATYARGMTRYYQGDLLRARADFQSAISRRHEEDFRVHLIDAGIRALNWSGPNEWHLGRPDQALRYAEEALAQSRGLKNPFAMASALAISTQVYCFRGDFGSALEASDEAMRLSTISGFPIWNAVGKIQSAWVRARLGEVAGAPDRIREGLNEFDNLEFHAARDRYLCMLCETQVLVGAVSDALDSVRQALEIDRETPLYRPYALTLRGDLRLRADAGQGAQPELAERDFREAIELARSMGAKSSELRATMSLARLLDSQGRRDEARTMLAAIYNWFTEGFDTADLKDARALLDRLDGES